METQPEGLAPEAAQARISELKADPAYIKGYLEGDPAKQAEMTKLHAAAFAEPAEGVPSSSDPAPAAAPAAPDVPVSEAPVESDALPIEPPSGPWEYDLAPLRYDPLGSSAASDAEVQEMAAIAGALYEAKVPSFAVNVVQMVAQRNLRAAEGKPFTDAELQARDRTCRAELTRKHGAQAASALIADAQKMAKRLEAQPRIAYLLDETAAGSDPHVVETLARVERGYYAKRG